MEDANQKDHSLLVLLLGALIVPMLVGDVVPDSIKSMFYAASLTIKGAIVFVLPFIIFTFISHSLVTLRKGALSFVVILVSIVLFSNFSAIMIGYQVSQIALPFLTVPVTIDHSVVPLEPMWIIQFPKIIANENAMILGLLCGGLFSFWRLPKVINAIGQMNEYCMRFLKYVFLPILPFFIMGFVIKLDHDNILLRLVQSYSAVFFIVITAQFLYTAGIYLIASKFSITAFRNYVRNILPATFTAFTTMSSAATIPVTVLCTERNMPQNKNMARTVIPVTANIHTLGSAIGVTVLSVGTLIAFGFPVPTQLEFFWFALYFAIAKFAVVGIPGGVILVISPLLETYLGFTPEMIGIITSMYILFDPFGTATNVTCNGAFAIIFYRVYKAITGKELEAQESSEEAKSRV